LASLTIAGYELFSTKSAVEPVAISLFTERDRVALLVPRDGHPARAPVPVPADWTQEDLIELPDDLTLYVAYRASSREIAERLEASGFSLAVLRRGFERRMRQRADEIADALDDDDVSRAALAEMLREATFLDWSDGFRELMSDNVNPAWPMRARQELRTKMMRFIAEESEDGVFFGLSRDARWLLRAATEVCGPDAVVEYDVTDLIQGGWYELNQPIAEEAMTSLRSEARHNAPTIILTEGSTDGAVLETAVRLLAPHLVGYLTFLDFHVSNAPGGTGALVNMVRAFTAAGVLNRTLVLFDNDAAGRAAIRALARTRLPHSIRVATLPDLELARSYPTTGPMANAVQDVNGRAASLEMYFGLDVLRQENGDLTPVAWKSYEPAIDDWQGELADKPLLQQRFAEKIRRAKANPALLDSLDWQGIRQIIELAVRAFSDEETSRVPGEPASDHDVRGNAGLPI